MLSEMPTTRWMKPARRDRCRGSSVAAACRAEPLDPAEANRVPRGEQNGLVPTRSISLRNLGAWVIKCNPSKTPVEPMRTLGVAKPSWCVADNYRSKLMQPDQRVLLWVSAHAQRGIWGAGLITGEPSRDGRQLHVPVDIPLFDEPLTAAELTLVAGLHSMEVFRAPQQSNPSWVSAAELALVEPLLASRA